MQEIAARNYHTRIVEQIQYDSNYSLVVNRNYGNDISLTLNEDNTVKVVYRYRLFAPLLGDLSPKEIVGYAR